MNCAPLEGPLREKRLKKVFAMFSKSPTDVEMATRSTQSGAAMRCHGRSVWTTQPNANRRATLTNTATLRTLTWRTSLLKSAWVKDGIMWRSRSSLCLVICGMDRHGIANVRRLIPCLFKTQRQQFPHSPQPLHHPQARLETVQVDP